MKDVTKHDSAVLTLEEQLACEHPDLVVTVENDFGWLR